MYEAFIAEAKDQLRMVVEQAAEKSKGANMYQCPFCGSGTGKNHTGALSIHNDGRSWKCHKCNRGGDVFDFVEELHQNKDKMAAFEFVSRITGIPMDADAPAKMPEAKPKEPAADYKEYYDACKARMKDCDYLTKRGIPEALQQKFWCGYDPQWRHPKATNAPYSSRVIIPTGSGSYIARATEPDADLQKMKVGEVIPFNWLAIDKADRPVYIVEGEIDAMSIEAAGGCAVGLGSITMVDKFLTRYLETPKQPFIVALDNDGKEQTAAAQKKLVEGLKARGLEVIEYSPTLNYKDANDALCAEPEAFKASVAEGMRKARDLKAEAAAQYLAAYSAAGLLPDFMRDINGNFAPLQRTGYPGLDGELGGGLDVGLTVVGAISTLGKTTFCLQMACQMAEQGRDVMFYSLEMPKEELIAKTLSRHTAMANIGMTELWIPNRAIMRGYKNLASEAKAAVKDAADSFEKYAGHLFLFEGVGTVGVEDIRTGIETHIAQTGCTPIVFIDYLQILKPHNERSTDKQNTDRAVLELKKMTRDFKTHIVVISSFNRESYTEPVSMSSFKESGAVEYSSDVLLGLQYAGLDYVEGESDRDRKTRIKDLIRRNIEQVKTGYPQKIQIKILKNRNGSRGDTELDFYPRCNMFDVSTPFDDKRQ